MRHRATEGQEQSRHPRRAERAGERHSGRDRDRARARAAEGVRGDLGGADGEMIGQANHGSENAPRTGTAPAEGHSTAADADGAQRGTERRQRGFSCAGSINPYTPINMNHTARIIENRAFHSTAEKILKKGVDK